MQQYIRRYRDKLKLNSVATLKHMVKHNLYREDIPDDQYFFFNVKLDKHGEPILGVGQCEKNHTNKKVKCSSLTHFNLLLTSVALMSCVEYDGVFAVDGTHGITRNRFPLDVFGVIDLKGQLHPIAFMITSFETVYDFDHLYSGLIELAQLLDYNFDPCFIMQDAATASATSAKKHFPNVKNLMCFFHVMQNVSILYINSN